jgi:hypothetical protein
VVATLKRLSTHYVEIEDRIRFAGELEDAKPVVFWVTQRVATRVLAALVQLLEKEAAAGRTLPTAGRDVLQSFAQDAAVADLKRQTPVAADAAASGWLAHTVDFTPGSSGAVLTFRGGHGQSATLRMDLTELRQWLAIVHHLWARASWPLDVWPTWMTGEAASPQESVRH